MKMSVDEFYAWKAKEYRTLATGHITKGELLYLVEIRVYLDGVIRVYLGPLLDMTTNDFESALDRYNQLLDTTKNTGVIL